MIAKLRSRLARVALERYEAFFADKHRAYEVDGGVLYINVRESPMMKARVLGHYEPDKRAGLKQVLREGDTFFDVGANKGDFTVLGARLVGPSGSVFAFEPEPENARWLRRSVTRNRFSHVRVSERAVADKRGTSTLFLGRKSGWHTLLEGQPRRDAGTLEVELETLDHFALDHGIDEVQAIKIDVEGAELRVLAGAEKLLEASPDVTLLIDLHPKLGVDVIEVHEWLVQRGFRTFDMRGRPFHPNRETSEILARKGG